MSDLDNFRRQKDHFYKTGRQSPLTPEQKRSFQGLAYFPENPVLALEVTVQKLPVPDEIQMQTSTGEVQVYQRYAKVAFQVEGQPAELTLYSSGDGFFLPFVDSLANKETYGAGRYLEPEELGNDRFRIDFNYAYNPYCAYNEPQSLAARAHRAPMIWSCPIPPLENRLKVPIRAGEKIPQGDWVDHE